MFHLGIFGQEFYKIIVIFEISILKFCQIPKLRKKTQMPKFGTQNALFRSFGVEF